MTGSNESLSPKRAGFLCFNYLRSRKTDTDTVNYRYAPCALRCAFIVVTNHGFNGMGFCFEITNRDFKLGRSLRC